MMRIARDLISGLRIKLKSFGIPIQGPASTYGYNGPMIKNTSIPELTLNKKHNSINYHIVCKSVAARIRGCSPKLPPRIFGIEREHTSQGWRGEVRRIQSENGKFWQRLISAR